eukprot:gene4986-biopygen1635
MHEVRNVTHLRSPTFLTKSLVAFSAVGMGALCLAIGAGAGASRIKDRFNAVLRYYGTLMRLHRHNDTGTTLLAHMIISSGLRIKD